MEPIARSRPSDHVEQADRGRRGAGQNAWSHRLQRPASGAGDLSAGVFDCESRCWRRPSPARPAMSTRWRKRSAFRARHRAGQDLRARRLHYQRSLEGGPGICTTSRWSGRHSATAELIRILCRDRACHRYRRTRLRARRCARSIEEGLYIPIMKLVDRERDGKDRCSSSFAPMCAEPIPRWSAISFRSRPATRPGIAA